MKTMSVPFRNFSRNSREDVAWIMNNPTITIKEESPTVISTYQVRVFSIVGPAGPDHKGRIYVAPELKNLVVKLDVDGTWTQDSQPFRYTLKNVSFDVPEDLFRVPYTYSKFQK